MPGYAPVRQFLRGVSDLLRGEFDFDCHATTIVSPSTILVTLARSVCAKAPGANVRLRKSTARKREGVRRVKGRLSPMVR